MHWHDGPVWQVAYPYGSMAAIKPQNAPHEKTSARVGVGQGLSAQRRCPDTQCDEIRHPGPGCCAQAQPPARRRGLAARRGHGQHRCAALQALPAARAEGRRAPAAAGDAAWLRAGCQQLCGEHAHEPRGPAPALPGALPGARPPGQCAGLLELVRHRIGPRPGRSGPHHEGHRPGVPAAPGGPVARGHRRVVCGRQHGRAAGHAAPRALQGRGDALGHPAGHGPFRPRPGRRCW